MRPLRKPEEQHVPGYRNPKHTKHAFQWIAHCVEVRKVRSALSKYFPRRGSVTSLGSGIKESCLFGAAKSKPILSYLPGSQALGMLGSIS